MRFLLFGMIHIEFLLGSYRKRDLCRLVLNINIKLIKISFVIVH